MAKLKESLDGLVEAFNIGKAIIGLFKKIGDLIHKENCHHHLFDGTEHDGDICLVKYSFFQKHDHLRKIHRRFRYPEDGSMGKETIHGVFCYDKRDDDRGGKVNIVSGGVGAKHVEVEFESMVGRGIDFTVVVIGKVEN